MLSMAANRRLCIRVKLLRSLPTRFKVEVKVSPGSHASEAQVRSFSAPMCCSFLSLLPDLMAVGEQAAQ
jgi:hypothetical protein